jgi:UDP-N-acetylglucosamine--N-acetylmuramyl-(pentapeptide) pyrophosphoryl-undecaprenol N-acetylglucosamine transferase
MKNVLFFTSPIGLGHASRDIVIASKLDTDITFVTGGGATKLISDYDFKVKDLYRHDGFEVDEHGELKHTLRWLMNYWSYYKKCKVIAESIIRQSKPDLIVGDEDFASISIAQELGIQNVIITDVLKTQFTKGMMSFIEKRMNAVMEKMIDNSNLVIVPAEGNSHDNISYVGPVVRDVDPDRELLRKRLGFSKKTILLSVGGTDSGRFLVNKAVETYREVRDIMDAEMVIVSGPSLNIDARQEGVTCMGYTRNLHEMIYACDLLISLAGRSTVDEATAYGTPAIFIPIKNHFEQEENAKQHGFRFDDIYRLEDLAIEKLKCERGKMVIRNGANKASNLIMNLLT